MVVEEGWTSIHDVKKALDLIPTEKFLGVCAIPPLGRHERVLLLKLNTIMKI
ncbi:MAG: hypothetical protein JSV38_10765 [Desulfobacterales bacterium]|nr:MAG: hypothetical protein JSV38_10765 [Desulfobacterales bacterium]